MSANVAAQRNEQWRYEMSNPAQVNEALADASIETITAMALKAETPDADTDQSDAPGEGEQDVSASSGQTEEQAVPTKQESDKEVNFAKLRTKMEAQEREVQRLAEENKRLSERQYVSELPPEHAQNVAAVDEKIVAIGAKFQDGELTWSDYQIQLREASAERDRLTAAAMKAEISNEMREQAAKVAEANIQKTWEQTVDGFITSKPDAVDYATEEAKRSDLNTYVKALAADADNNEKPMEWFLQEAHALVKAKHRIVGAAPVAKADVKPVASQASPFHTLSDLPGGAPPARTEVEQLDQLSGSALSNRFLNDPASIDKLLATLA